MSKKKAIRDRIKDFRRVKASELFANPKNWREHPKAQQAALLGVLEEIGYADALLARELPDGSLVLVDGHLRKETTPDQEVPVLVLDIDEDEAKKLLAVLDPLAAMAEANTDALGQLLAEIGTESDALQAMLDDLAEENGIDLSGDVGGDMADPEPQVDRAAELQKEWGTEVGQLWVIPGKAGEHRLLCGDSTKAEDVSRVLDGQVPNVLVADPPYGMNLDADYSGMKGFSQSKKHQPVIGDQEDFDASAVCGCDMSEQYWFGADYYAKTLGDTEHQGSWMVWDKRLDESADKMFGSCFELVWTSKRQKRKILRHKWAGFFTNGEKRDFTHPTTKPVSLIVAILEGSEGSVYDPFLGSGTTMVAAENLGRICYGMEISPAYCAVILQRMKDMDLEPRLSA